MNINTNDIVSFTIWTRNKFFISCDYLISNDSYKITVSYMGSLPDLIKKLGFEDEESFLLWVELL